MTKYQLYRKNIIADLQWARQQPASNSMADLLLRYRKEALEVLLHWRKYGDTI